MNVISLKEFVLSGCFGPVYLGMPLEELKKHFGKPADSYDSGMGSGLWFYNGFEFYYYTKTNTLFGIQNDNICHEGPEKKSEHLYFFDEDTLIDTWFLDFGKKIPYRKVVTRLQNEGISFETENRGDYDELRFSSGVAFDFENREGISEKEKVSREEASLIGIRYFLY